jgi:hypothetical protein
LSERLLAVAHNNADRVFGKWPFTGKQLGCAAIRIGNRMLIWRNTMLLRSLTFIGEDGSLTVSGVGWGYKFHLHSERKLSFVPNYNKPPHLRVYKLVVSHFRYRAIVIGYIVDRIQRIGTSCFAEEDWENLTSVRQSLNYWKRVESYPPFSKESRRPNVKCWEALVLKSSTTSTAHLQESSCS